MANTTGGSLVCLCEVIVGRTVTVNRVGRIARPACGLPRGRLHAAGHGGTASRSRYCHARSCSLCSRPPDLGNHLGSRRCCGFGCHLHSSASEPCRKHHASSVTKKLGLGCGLITSIEKWHACTGSPTSLRRTLGSLPDLSA